MMTNKTHRAILTAMGRINGAAFPLIKHEKEAMELEAAGLIERVPKGADAPGWRLTKKGRDHATR